MNEKLLSIKEIQNEIKRIENNLELYLNLKSIAFDKTQTTTTIFKDVFIDTASRGLAKDVFSSYMIKNEEYDDKIYDLTKSLLYYQTCFLNEIMRMKQYDDIPLIRYLKEELNWNWQQIDKYLNLGTDYARTKLRNYNRQN